MIVENSLRNCRQMNQKWAPGAVWYDIGRPTRSATVLRVSDPLSAKSVVPTPIQ